MCAGACEEMQWGAGGVAGSHLHLYELIELNLIGTCL